MTGEEARATFSASEVLLRQRFEQAVGGLSVDAVSFVNAGIATGRQEARRRHRMQIAGGLASATAVLVAGGVVSMQGGLFHVSTSTPAGRGDQTERVSSNPRALAAAVIADLPHGSEVLAAGGSSNVQWGLITATVAFTTNGRTVRLKVVASQPRPGIGPQVCPQPGNLVFCGGVSLGDGRQVWSTVYSTSIAGQPGLELSVDAGGVSVTEYVSGARTVNDVPVSRTALANIADDPLVGWMTSSAMVEQGASLHDFTVTPAGPDAGGQPVGGQPPLIAPSPVTPEGR